MTPLIYPHTYLRATLGHSFLTSQNYNFLSITNVFIQTVSLTSPKVPSLTSDDRLYITASAGERAGEWELYERYDRLHEVRHHVLVA